MCSPRFFCPPCCLAERDSTEITSCGWPENRGGLLHRTSKTSSDIYIYMYTYVVHHEEPKAGHNTNSVTQIDSSSSVPAELLEAFPLGLWVHVLCLGSTVWQRTVRHLDQQHGFGAGLKSPEPVLLWRPRRARPED